MTTHFHDQGNVIKWKNQASLGVWLLITSRQLNREETKLLGPVFPVFSRLLRQPFLFFRFCEILLLAYSPIHYFAMYKIQYYNLDFWTLSRLFQVHCSMVFSLKYRLFCYCCLKIISECPTHHPPPHFNIMKFDYLDLIHHIQYLILKPNGIMPFWNNLIQHLLNIYILYTLKTLRH